MRYSYAAPPRREPPRSTVRVDRSGSVYITPSSAPPLFPFAAIPTSSFKYASKMSVAAPRSPVLEADGKAKLAARAVEARVREADAENLAAEALARCRALEDEIRIAREARAAAEEQASLTAMRLSTTEFDLARERETAGELRVRAERCETAERNARSAEVALADVASELAKARKEHVDDLEAAAQLRSQVEELAALQQGHLASLAEEIDGHTSEHGVALSAWERQQAAMVAALEAQKAEILSHRSELGEAEALRQAAEIDATMRKRRLQFQFFARLERRHLSQGFRTWTLQLREAARQRALVVSVLGHFANQRLALGLTTWRKNSKLKSRREALVDRVISRIDKGRHAAAWRKWIEGVRELEAAERTRAEHRRVMKGMLNRMRSARLARGLNTWLSGARSMARQERVMNGIIGRLTKGRMGAGFRAWRLNGNELERQTRLCKAVLRHITHAQLSAGFRTWFEEARALTEQRKLMLGVLSRLSNRKTAQAVSKLRFEVALQKRQEVVVHRALARIVAGKKAIALATWRVNTSESFRKQALVRRVLGYCQRSKLGTAFRTLHTGCHVAFHDAYARRARKKLIAVVHCARLELTLSAEDCAEAQEQRDKAWAAEAAARAAARKDAEHLDETLESLDALRASALTADEERAAKTSDLHLSAADALRPMPAMPSASALAQMPASIQTSRLMAHNALLSAEIERLRRVVRQQESIADAKARVAARATENLAQVGKELRRERERKAEARVAELSARDEAAKLRHDLRVSRSTTLAVNAFADAAHLHSRQHGSFAKNANAARVVSAKWGKASALVHSGAMRARTRSNAATASASATNAGSPQKTHAAWLSAAASPRIVPSASSPQRRIRASALESSPTGMRSSGAEGASLVRITRNGSVHVGHAPRDPDFGALVPGKVASDAAAGDGGEASDTFDAAAVAPPAVVRERAHHTSLVKRRKGRRLSVHHDTSHEHTIEGWLMKKSKSNAWQMRYFTTRSHYLMYSKKPGGELLGGVDLAGVGSSVDAVNLVTSAGGELATLRLKGLDSDAHGGTHGFGAETHGVMRTMELCWERKLESKRAAGGKRNPTLAEWHSTLVRAAVAMREEAGIVPPNPSGVANHAPRR